MADLGTGQRARGTAGSYGRDRLQHCRSRASGGRPRGRQSPERDALGLELDHGRVGRYHPQPQRRELPQEAGFLHGERVLLRGDVGKPALEQSANGGGAAALVRSSSSGARGRAR
jgi:hypothetical protein